MKSVVRWKDAEAEVEMVELSTTQGQTEPAIQVAFYGGAGLGESFRIRFPLDSVKAFRIRFPLDSAKELARAILVATEKGR